MIRNVLENIPGIEFYPVFALIIFVLFFATLLVWFARADKNKLALLAQLPLDENQRTPHTTQSNKE